MNSSAVKWSTIREGLVRMSATALDPNRSYVYGIALPNVRSFHPDDTSRKKEYDKNEIQEIDMTGIDMRANHKDDDVMHRIGEIVAYEPLNNEARVLGVLDDDEFEGQYGEAAAMIDYYGSMSLTHRHKTVATYSASSTQQSPQQELIISKTALEVSLCKVPAREGAQVVEVCPSERALLRQPREFLRRFAVRYNYPLPPEVPHEPKFSSSKFVTTKVALNTPVLENYVKKTLSPLVQQRLHNVVNNAKFVRNITIMPSPATQHLKRLVGTGVVKMSASANSMQIDGGSGGGAPTPTPTQQSNPTQPTPTPTSTAGSSAPTSAPTGAPPLAAIGSGGAPPGTKLPTANSGAPTPAAGGANGMALDPPTPQQPGGTTTQTRSSDMTLSPDDDPLTMAIKFAAMNEKLQQRVNEMEQRDIKERERREREQRELEVAKIRDLDLSAQTAASTIAEKLKMSPEERKLYDDNRAFIIAEGAKNNWSADYINKLMGGMLSATVSASKRAKPDLEHDQEAQQRAAARDLYLRFTANKTPIALSGGYNSVTPPTTQPSTPAPTPILTPMSSSSSSTSSTPSTPKTYPSYFNLSQQDYTLAEERQRWEQEQARKRQEQQQRVVVTEGTVSASRTATTTTGGAGDQEEWTPETPDVIRKVWLSGVVVNEDGTLTLPSQSWVARGGDVEVAIEKRSANGEMITQTSIQPRWKEPVKVGPQHLFPDKVAEALKILQQPDANPDESLLTNMARLGKMHEQRNIIPKFTSRRREPSRNWYYIDKRWRGKEDEGNIVVTAAFA
jgi:hypothetical protein